MAAGPIKEFNDNVISSHKFNKVMKLEGDMGKESTKDQSRRAHRTIVRFLLAYLGFRVLRKNMISREGILNRFYLKPFMDKGENA